MHMYLVEYGFVGNLGAIVARRAKLVYLSSGSETEALAAVKRQENGSWKSYGKEVEVVIFKITKK